MRAIDADALKKELAPYEENDFSQQIDVILKIVDAQPTLTPPNEWVRAKEQLPEAGKLIVYANKFGNEALYGILRVPKNERSDRYDYWMYLQEVPDRRPPERQGGDADHA